MAARRLLIVMLILLALSSIASLLVPTRDTGEDEGSTASEATTTEATTAGAEASASPAPPGIKSKVALGGPKRQVVPLLVDQALTLDVTSGSPVFLEIPKLGLIEPASPGLPARFFLLVSEPGSYGIRILGTGQVVARLDVTETPPPSSAKKPSKKSRARGGPGSAS